MATAAFKVQGLLVLFLLANGAFTVSAARPLSIIKEVNAGIEEDTDVFDWLSLGSVKQSGPSAPGEGHKFTNSDTLGGIKNSGPSAGGGGHKFTNSQTFGDVKDSGPSGPGQGH
ncbi:PAMP-induced secreted peptide 2-like [Neltuma alba]|uniref:PAMP-induced secreted peptide 2-like n=1 Tax=Neltuma alba TaxID=207710 RepID=UPI0010A39FA1|nr:PAMP-induced secreted peptide 2-like [Prosopis alba]XP_028764161.1 PAMP-induced secreted peptide 2-like [Prosopis alba]XP_028788111.1 PAMP-induced secreted peptide 2-like [Prosopis alba]